MSTGVQSQIAQLQSYADILDQVATLKAEIIIKQHDKRREIAKQPIRMNIHTDERGAPTVSLLNEDMEGVNEITQGFNYAGERRPPSMRDIRLWYEIQSLYHIGMGYVSPQQIPVLTAAYNGMNAFMQTMSFSRDTANPLALMRTPNLALPGFGQPELLPPQPTRRRVEPQE